MKKMNFKLIISVLCVFTILIDISCKKQAAIEDLPKNTKVLRTVRFVLYSDKDLSADQDDITFKLFIENSKYETLWDSALAPIKIKDIPNSANKLVVEKRVPNDDNSLLRVGFRYSIGGVGNSRHYDSIYVGEAFKIVEFNFH